jgi:hypothetical protein
MEQTSVLSEVRWPYTSNLAYLESDEDVEPCHVGCGCLVLVGAWVALYLAGTVQHTRKRGAATSSERQNLSRCVPAEATAVGDQKFSAQHAIGTAITCRNCCRGDLRAGFLLVSTVLHRPPHSSSTPEETVRRRLHVFGAVRRRLRPVTTLPLSGAWTR